MALIQAAHISMTIGNAITGDPGASASDFRTQLDAVAATEIDFEVLVKEMEMKEPEIATEIVKLLGVTSSRQNSEIDPQAPTKAELTATLAASPEDDNDFDFYQFKNTAHGTTATNYDKRYNLNTVGPTAGVGVVIQINEGSGKPIRNILMNNATIETLGGIKIDADGHATQDIRISCDPDDAWTEWDLNGGS